MTRYYPINVRNNVGVLSVIVLLLASCYSTIVDAATYTWDGGGTNNNWSTIENWTNDVPPVSASNTTVQLDGIVRTSPVQNIANPFILNRLDILNGPVGGGKAAFVLSGSQLQFQMDGATQPRVTSPREAVSTVANDIDIPIGTTVNMEFGTYGVDFSGVISGGGSIDKLQNAGGISLNNKSNSFSGGLTIRGIDADWYKVNINASNAMGTGQVNLYGGTLTTNAPNAGGLLLFNTTSHTNAINLFQNSPIFAGLPAGTANATLNGNIDLNTYTLRLRGGGTGRIGGIISEGDTNAIIKVDLGTWTLSATNTFTGAVIISNGTLAVQTDGALGDTGYGTTVMGFQGSTSSVLSLNPSAGNITVAEPLTIQGTANGRARLANNAGSNTYSGNITIADIGLGVSIDANAGSLLISGDITGNFASVFFVRGAANGTITGSINITGGGGLTKTDFGTWTIGAPGKTYSWGASQIAVGTVKLGATNAFPVTTTLTIGQGDANIAVFDLNGYDQTLSGLALSSTGGSKLIANFGNVPATLTVSNASNYSFGGVLTNGVSVLNLVKDGPGTLTLTGTNVYSGNTIISNGTIDLRGQIVASMTLTVDTNAMLVISNAAGNALSDVQTLVLNAGPSTTGKVQLTTSETVGSLYFDSTVQAAGTWGSTASSAVNKDDAHFSGTGVLTVLVSNPSDGSWLNDSDGNWSAAANWTNGVIAMGSGSSAYFTNEITGDRTINQDSNTLFVGNMIFGSPGTYNWTVTNQPVLLVTTSGVPMINVTANAATISSVVAGYQGLTKSGTGTLTLSGTNSYSGNTTIDNGTLSVSGSGNLGNGTYIGNVLLSNDTSTLDFSSSKTQTLSGVISGNGALRYTGSGTMTLSGANTFTGGTIMATGTLVVANNSALGTGTITMNGGTLVPDATARTLNNAIQVTAGTSTELRDNGDLFLNGPVSGSGTLTINSPISNSIWPGGDFSGFSGTINYSVISGGVNLRVTGSATNFSNATLIMGGATSGRGFIWNSTPGIIIQVGALSGTGGIIGLGQGNAFTLQVGALNTDTAFSGIITTPSTGVISLNKVGTGTLTLSSTNTYNGGTVISSGTLRLASVGSIAGCTNVTIEKDGILSNESTCGNIISDTATLVLNSDATTTGKVYLADGIAENVGSLSFDAVPQASGTWGSSLSLAEYKDDNHFTGKGILVVGSPGSNGSWANNADGNWSVAANWAGNTIALGAGRTAYFTNAITSDRIISQDSNSVFIGNLTFGSPGTYNWTLQNNLLLLAASNGNPVITANANVAGISSTIAGNQGFTKSGPGTLMLLGTNNYTGTTRLNAGTLLITNDTNLGDASAGLVFGGGLLKTTNDLTINRSVILNASAVISNESASTLTIPTPLTGGALNLTKQGPGTLVLAGSNTYSGTTFLMGGTMNLTGNGYLANSLRLYSNSVFYIQDNASADFPIVFLGEWSSSPGNLYHINGSIRVSGHIRIGHYPTETSTYVMSNGSLRITSTTGTNPFGTGEQGNGTLYLGIDGTGIFIQNGGTVDVQAVVLDNRTGAGETAGIDTYTLNAGTLTLGMWGIQGQTSTVVNFAGGTVKGTTNWACSVPMALLAAAGGNTIFDTSSGNITLSGPISGTGVLVKISTGTLALSGTNSYSGSTIISNGTFYITGMGTAASSTNIVIEKDAMLSIDSASGNSIGDTARLTLNSDVVSTGRVFLGSGVMDTVGSIYFNSTPAAAGTWGSSVSSADNKDDSHFSGTGILRVGSYGNDGSWTNNASGNWNTAGNWTNSVIPYGDNRTAYFTNLITADRIVTQDSISNLIGNLTFGSSGTAFNWTLAGDPLQLSSYGQAVISVTTNTATISAVITGIQGFVKSGPGTLVLAATNTYTGTTRINAGILSITNDTNLGAAGAALTFAGGTLRTTNTITFSNRTVTITTGGGTFTNDPGSTLTIPNPVVGGNTLTKNGAGSLVLNGTNVIGTVTHRTGGLTFSGANSTLGAVNTYGGTTGAMLNINGTINLGGNNMQIGNAAGDRSVVTVTTNAFMNKMFVGNSGSAGATYQTGGVLNIGTNVVSTDVTSIGVNGGHGYYRMSGGVLNTGQFSASAGSGTGNIGVFDMYGGTLNVVKNAGGWFISGGWGPASKGSINMFGGTMSGPAANPVTLSIFANNAHGMINLLGASAVLIATNNGNGLNMMGGTGNSNATFNLNAGTLVASRIYQGSASPAYFNFNGGTLRAHEGGLTVTMTMNTGGGAYVYSGGAIINPTNSTVVISTPLRAPTGYGVTNISVTDGGAGYIGAPFVLISGGSGKGATAIAQIDINQVSPTFGQITNILVTSPGVDYQQDDSLTVTLAGGGAITPATIGTITLGPNVGGGLTKTGATGTLRLSAGNSYSGSTLVYTGVLYASTMGAFGGTTNITIEAGGQVIIDTTSTTINNSASINLKSSGSVYGKLYLTNGLTEIVSALYSNGVALATGTWGRTSSGCMYTNDNFFSGPGLLIVRTGYGQWITDADGNWNTGSNWTNNIVPLGSMATAYFTNSISGDRAINQDIATLNMANLWFGSPLNNWNWSVTNNTINFTNALTTPVITVTTNTATIGSSVAGLQGVVKSGPGTLILSGYSNTLGLLSVNAGSLNLNGLRNSISNVNISGATTFNGETNIIGVLTLNRDTMTVNGITNNITNVTVFAGTLAFNGLTNTIGPTTLRGGQMLFTSGTNLLSSCTVNGGTLTFADSTTNTFTNNLYMSGGTNLARMNIYGPMTINNNFNLQIGNSATGRAVVTITTNGTIWRAQIGYNAVAAAGALFQSNGLIRMTGIPDSEDTFVLGRSFIDAYGYYNMSGGTLSNAARFAVGLGGNGVVDMTGGLVTAPNIYTIIGRNYLGSGTSYGILNISGGTMYGSVTNGLRLGNDASTAARKSVSVINVGGTGTLWGAPEGNTTRYVEMMISAQVQPNVNQTMINLNGGTFIVNQIRASYNSGLAVIGFNGGLLKANAGTTLGLSFLQNMSAAYVYPGGAYIDSDASVITIAQPLLAPTGYGASSVAFTGGSGYIGAPVVAISGGSGTGATAIAQMDFSTGQITNILVTSAGSGYQAGDTLTATLLGGGYLTPGTAGPVTLSSNSCGNLIKIGTGTLRLTGTSTYTGMTIISNGTLAAAGPVAIALSTGIVICAGAQLDLEHDSNLINDNSTVDIKDGGSINLTNGLLEIVGSLYSNGTLLAVGTWGASGSGAMNTNDTLFKGTGMIGTLVTGDGSWDNPSSGLWSESPNWTNGAVAYGATQTAYFTNNISADCTINQNISVLPLGNLIFGSPNSYNWALKNSPIWFTNSATPIIAVNANTTRLRTVIQGQQGFIKTGTGTLEVSAMGDYTGPTIISAGTLRLGLVGGLLEGRLAGTGLNTTLPNPATNYVKTTRMANTNVKPPWADYETWVYTGFINNIETNNVTWTFAENIDDNTYLVIDGTVLLNDGGWNTTTKTNYTLTPGYHTFELRLYNGAGGAGCVNSGWWNVNNFGFGYDQQGRNETNVSYYQAMTDSGNGDLFACPYGSLPTNSAMFVAANATFDLYGIAQGIGSLSDYSGAGGFVTNSTATMATLTVGYDDTSTTFSGIIAGYCALTKAGNGMLTLTGQSPYIGDTRVNRGTLNIAPGSAIRNSPNITVDGGGELVVQESFNALMNNANMWIRSGRIYLTNGCNYFVSQLVLGEETRLSGTWGSSSSSAANKDDTYFSGNGILTVTSDYAQTNSSSWAVDSSGSWINSFNWLNKTIAYGIDQTAYFTNWITGNVTVTNAHASMLLGNLSFNSPCGGTQNWTIDGNTITLTNSAVTPTITVNSDTANIANLIDSLQGVLKTGGGTLQIGTGSTSGWLPANIAVSAGVLGFSRSDNIVFSNRITFTSGTGYKDAGGTLTLTYPGTNILAIGGNDAFTVRNGKLVFAGGIDSAYRITGELVVGNTVGTSTILEISNGYHNVSGYLTLGKGAGSGTASNLLILSSGTLNAGGISLLGTGATNNIARFSLVNGVLNLGDSGYGGYGSMTTNCPSGSTRQVLLSGGTIGVLNNYVGLPVAMIITNSPGSGTVAFRTSNTNNAAKQMTLFGGLSGTGTVVKTGTGTLYLNSTGINYRGSMIVSNGTLSLANVAFTGAVSIASGAALSLPGGLRGEYYSLAGVTPASISNDYASLTNHFSTNRIALLAYTGVTGSNLSFGATGTNFPAPFNAGGTAVQNMEARWTGKFLAETSGTYTFGVDSDDGCTVFVDTTNVFWKGGGGVSNMIQQTGTIALGAGLHDIVIGYYQGGGGYGLTLYFAKPGGATNILSNDLLSYANGTTLGSLSADYGSTLSVNSDTLVIYQTIDRILGCTFNGSCGTIIKNGTAKLTFGGASSFTGSMIISNGTIAVTTAGEIGCSNLTLSSGTRFVVENSTGNVIGDNAAVRLNGGGSSGKIYLTNGVVEIVSSLYLDGAAQPPGTYGSTGSSATTKDDTRFEGTGILLVAGTQTGSWAVDADGGWNTAGNWTGSVIPFGSGTAYFTNSITANHVVDQDYANLLIGGMTFGSPAAYNWTITNSYLRLLGPGIVNVTTNTATIASAITGNSGLTKMGAGTLVLSGTNNFMGTLIITNGTLMLGADNTLPTTQGSTILASILDLNGFSNTVRNISGLGIATCSIASNATLVLSNDTPTTFSGKIVNGAGTVSIIKNGAAPLTLSVNTNSCSDFTIAEGTLKITSGETITGFGINGLGWQVNSGNITSTAIANNELTLTDNGASQYRSAFFATPITLRGAFTARFVYTAGGNKAADGAAFIIQNSAAGPSALGGSGGGIGYSGIGNSMAVEFNLYTGGGQPIGTTNRINGATGQFVASAPVNIASGNPILVQITYDPATKTLTEILTDQVTFDTKTFIYNGLDLASILGGSTGYIGFSGATGGAYSTQTISDFFFSAYGSASPMDIKVAPVATLDLNGANLSISSLANHGVSGGTVTNSSTVPVTLTVGETGNSSSFSGTITDNGSTNMISLVKSGSGIFNLAGINTFSGTVSVNAGTLFVDGSKTSSNSVTVTNGAALAGAGTISGNVILLPGAELSPAGSNTAGVITIGDLSLSSNASIRLDYSTSNSFDAVAITNQFNISSNVIINIKLYNFNALPQPSTQQFVIATWPATVADPDANVTWNILKPAGSGAEGWASPQVSVDTASNQIVMSFPLAGFPAVDNGVGATAITSNSATLNGNYTATGSTAEVHIYWGPSDGGTNKANWENVYVHGSTGVGAFSTTVTNLVYGHLYQYRCYASNVVGECWATLSSNFSVQAQDKLVDGIRGSIFDALGGGTAPLLFPGASYSISYTRVLTGGSTANILGKTETSKYNVIITGDLYSGTDLAGFNTMFPGYVTREQFSSAYSGVLIPRYSGQHDFRWNCDDYGSMYIDVNNDGTFQAGEGSTTGTAPWYGTNSQTLVAGQQYNYIFMAKDDGGGESVNLWVTEPSQPEARVNPTVQAGMWKCYAVNTISTLPATQVTTTSAVLNATLVAPGEVYNVYAYWGTNNAGTNMASWANSMLVGTWTNEASTNISLALPSLIPDTVYSFTFRAENAITAVWAERVRDFKTVMTQASYGKKMLITFNGYNKEETLTNFPAIVSLGEYLPGFNYYDCRPAGTDIRFMDESETTELNYEIEQWNTNGTSYMWVQVPQLSSNSSIWVYWNKPDSMVPPPYSTNGTTWTEGYAGVWHLCNTNALGQLPDSTASHFDGLNTSTAPDIGKIASGRLFNGSAYVNVGDAMPQSSYTKMLWVSRTNSAVALNNILSGGSGAADHVLWINASGGTILSAGHNGSWYQTQDPVAIPVNTWALAAVTYDADTQVMTLYKDGYVVNEASAISMHANGLATFIGAYAAGSQFQGMIDEVSISSVPRSSNWVWACYMNQGYNSSFSTYRPMFGIKNVAVSNLTSVSATPVATLYGTGLATTVTLFFGTTDGGTNASGWSSSKNLGAYTTFSNTNITTILNGLKPDTVYYFRFRASNIEDTAWTVQAFFKTLAADWQLYRKMKITFQGYNKPETLNNFPALLVFNTGIGSFQYNTFRPGGTDLRFLNEAKTTELNYEIEEWNTASNSYIWVQVPQFTNNCSIWAYWGASTYVLPCTTNGTTWSNGYGSVWHLRDGTSNTYDAVAHNTGTPVNVTSITGMISRALNFNGSNALMNTTYAQPSVTAYTISTWIRTTDVETNRMILNDRGGGAAMSLSLGLRTGPGRPFFGLDSSTALIGQDADNPINDDAWHYLAGVWSSIYGGMIDASQFKIYVDGEEVTSTPTSSGTVYSPLSGAGGSQIAYHQAWTTNLTAKLDELRADTAARSSNWIWACYMNQGTNRTSFVQYGDVTRIPWQGTVIRLK